MQTENWKKVKDLLLTVLPLDPFERRSFFDKSSVDGEIRGEVESLLTFEKNSENLMNMNVVEFLRDFIISDRFDEQTPIGQNVGIYKIVGELGFGGMGAVYLAERADGKFKQKVAVKMLKREFNVERIRQTFRREKEILAALVHPNIARLLDAGKTDDNIPFIVMEYIAGVSVVDFCSANSLDVNARLKLFIKICEAVGFAHRNLIIHRDLKPSNIMVTKSGDPKLLDFGISKLLVESSETSKSTTILSAMTPDYASPEQIKGKMVTTATDIYSLGVVLFQMLTGSLPLKVENRAGPEAVSDLMRPPPVTPRDTKRDNAKSKIPNPKSVRGDLDNIIRKSLSEEPERRYQTVEQFAADLWRYIDGLPVSARPANFSYRARKFYGRNKIALIAGVLVFLSLLAGITVSMMQTIEARYQGGMALAAQREAEVETAKAKKISDFMGKVISYANPAWYATGSRFGGDAKVIDVLDDLSDKIDAEFAGQPDVQAELHHKFTEVYAQAQGRGKVAPREKFMHDKQNFHARRALQLRKQHYGEKHELVAKDMYYVSAALENGPDKAELLAGAIAMMRETNPDNLNLPHMLNDFAGFLIWPEFESGHQYHLRAAIPPTDKNRYQLAEACAREALRLFRGHYTEDNLAFQQGKCSLAYSLVMQNKMAEFEQHHNVCSQDEEMTDLINLALVKNGKLE